MSKVQDSFRAGTEQKRGSTMTQERKIKKPDDVKVFPANARPSLKEISPEKFANAFCEYAELLVHVMDQKVVAAARVEDRDQLLEAFRKEFPNEVMDEYVFENGAKALLRAVATGESFAERRLAQKQGQAG
jgi:hypothetical protein